MTYTETITFTCTFTRADLIQFQVNWALREMKPFDDYVMSRVLYGISEGYIAEIIICGIDPADGKRVNSARLVFDWD
ncbi:MAG: hypothetical protein ACREP9_13875, partial [Candidatus Dormibacteraceae bacterium]